MTQRKWILFCLAAAVVVVACVATFWFKRPHETQPQDYKSAVVDSCMKKANEAAQQHGDSYNEEQKKILLQICGCIGDQTAQQFTPQEVSAFAANPDDATMLARITKIRESCAAQAKMPATNP